MTFDEEYFNIGYLDRLSFQDTFVHRLDPITKLLATVAFIITVVSFPKYEIKGLLPFFLFPVLLLTIGDIPLKFIIKKILIVSPFAVFIGILNPVFDSETRYVLWGVGISGGWISFLSIMIKFVLTIGAALLLIATSSFPGVCRALQRLGLPDIFISQLMFLYRYLFVLMEETMKIVRARDMRSFGNKGTGSRTFIGIVGVLLIRTIERAERIYNAMLSRGFTGKIIASRKVKFGFQDMAFLAIALAAALGFRYCDITGLIGNLFIDIAGKI